MSKAIVSESKLTAIADAIRSRFGVSGELTLDEMEESILSLSALRIPSAYQEVEYIGSTGTQYIDTGYVPKLTTRWEFVWQVIEGDTSDECRNGRYGGGDGERFSICAMGVNSSSSLISDNKIEFAIGTYLSHRIGTAFYVNNNLRETPVIFTKSKIVLNAPSTSYNLNDGLFTGSLAAALTFNSNQALYLFARNTANGIDGCGTSRIYSHKIWENGTKVQDFVPCYRKADGVIGMYDLVSKTFFGNAGTGTFTKGADV